jgi:hypothetical protein
MRGDGGGADEEFFGDLRVGPAASISLSLDGRIAGPGGEYDMDWTVAHALLAAGLVDETRGEPSGTVIMHNVVSVDGGGDGRGVSGVRVGQALLRRHRWPELLKDPHVVNHGDRVLLLRFKVRR